MAGRIASIVTGPGFLLLVGVGFQVSEFKSNVVAIALWVVAAAWLVANLTPLRERIPQVTIRRAPRVERDIAGRRSLQLRNGLRVSTRQRDYRAALRQVARLLYVNEGLYSQASGGGELSDEAVWQEAAPKAWGDELYGRLGLPLEDEYR